METRAAEAPSPKSFTEAQALFKKGSWQAAETAFLQNAASGVRKYESLYMAALCKEKRNRIKQAEADYAQLIRDEAAYRQAPDSIAECYLRLHAIMCGRKNSASQRSVLLAECARRFPRHAVLRKMYAREAAEWLKAGNAEKARQSYANGKGLLSEPDATMAELLAPAKTCPVSDAELEKLAGLTKTEKEIPLGPLCAAIALRPGGWQAECLYADALAGKGKTNEAIARYDALLQQRIGPEAEIRLARAETIAFRSTHERDALPLYEKWIQAYPRHRMREKALYQYALLLGKSGKPDMAVQFLENVLKEFPSGTYAAQAREQQEKFRAAAKVAAKQDADAKEHRQTIREDPLLASLERAEKALRTKAYPLAMREYQRFRGHEIHPK